MNECIETNRRHWNEVVPLHYASAFYDVASFKAGKSSLLSIERDEVGDVRGKTLLHLQCHFGMDTLSWAREGAIVTGIDFAPEAIRTARELASELKIDARFIETNLYDLPQTLQDEFDIVFTSYGTLVWLPDLEAWARIAASYVKPGGFFYIADGHPFYHSIWESPSAGDIRATRDYFGTPAPEPEEDDGTYAVPDAHIENRRVFEFDRSLGAIVTALIDAGLRLEFLHEFPFSASQALKGMVRGDDRYYRLPAGAPRVPILFSLKASKPG